MLLSWYSIKVPFTMCQVLLNFGVWFLFKKCFLLGKERRPSYLLPFYPAPCLCDMLYFGDHRDPSFKDKLSWLLYRAGHCHLGLTPKDQELPVSTDHTHLCSCSQHGDEQPHHVLVQIEYISKYIHVPKRPNLMPGYMQVAKIWVTSLIQWRFSLNLII